MAKGAGPNGYEAGDRRIEEMPAYMDFPYEHWVRIRTNNVIERLNREIRRSTRGRHFSRRQFGVDAGMCLAAACCRNPVGLKEVHEHEASGKPTPVHRQAEHRSTILVSEFAKNY